MRPSGFRVRGSTASGPGRGLVERFPDELRLVKLNGRDWRLASSYRFRSSAFGTIEVPAGFETDLASVPWFARCFVAVDGEWTKPAVVHDWLYSPAAAGLRLTRRQADAAFLDALRVRGVSPLLGRVLWLAVRLGGRRAFRRAAGAS